MKRLRKTVVHHVIGSLVLGLFACCSGAYAQYYEFPVLNTMSNTDLPGNDIQHYVLPSSYVGNIDLREGMCQGHCARNSNCASYTYVKPNVIDAFPHCYLKNTIPAAYSNSCCNSGSFFEADTDRAGADYRSFNSSQPRVCMDACMDESQCRAWTWVKPGIQAASGVCWLKTQWGSASPNTCCTSGRVEKGILH